MTPSPISSLGRDVWNATEKPEPQSAAEAAQQFEALLVGQLLRDVRKSGGGGWLSSGEDQASDTMIEFAEEQIANALTQAGGLGLSRMIESSLQKASETAQSSTSSGKAVPKSEAHEFKR